jgi:hypothetical protein
MWNGREGIVELGFLTQSELEKYQVLYVLKHRCTTTVLFENFLKHLKENKLTQCKVDPCLFYSKDKDGEIDLLLTLFVKGILVAGRCTSGRKMLKNTMALCNDPEEFYINILGKLKKHLGVWCTRTITEIRLDIIDSFQKAKPGIEVKNHSTPATTGTSNHEEE